MYGMAKHAHVVHDFQVDPIRCPITTSQGQDTYAYATCTPTPRAASHGHTRCAKSSRAPNWTQQTRTCCNVVHIEDDGDVALHLACDPLTHHAVLQEEDILVEVKATVGVPAVHACHVRDRLRLRRPCVTSPAEYTSTQQIVLITCLSA